MSFLRALPAACLLAVAVTLSPNFALAQGLMANELWLSWQGGVERRGGALTAIEKREGNKLLLSNVHFEPVPGEGVFEIEAVALVNQADGSVSVTLPETFPLVMGMPGKTEGAVRQDVVLSISAPQLDFIVRGIGARADFQLTAPEITISLDKILPEPVPDADRYALAAVLRGADLRFLQDLALDVPILDGALSFESFDALLTKGPSGQMANDSLGARVENFSASLSAAFPTSAAPLWAALRGTPATPPPLAVVGMPALAKPDATKALPAVTEDRPSLIKALADGLKASLQLSYGPMSLHVKGKDDHAKPLLTELTSEGGKVTLGLDMAKVAIDTALNGLRLSISGNDATDPAKGEIVMTLPEYLMTASLGLNGLNGPQDWAARYVMRDLDLSPTLWRLADLQLEGEAQPLSLVLDLAGRYAVDPEALRPDWSATAAIAAGKNPITQFSVKLNELTLAALGVDISGRGEIALDPRDLQTYAGFPRPNGRLSFLTKGLYGLIDRMTEQGAMTPDQLSTIRAGLLMLGRAGETEDSLITDLDFRDTSFFLNGHKLH